MKYHIHDDTGRILEQGDTKEPTLRLDLYPGATVVAPVEGGDQRTHYYADGVLTERPANGAAPSKAVAVADGVDKIAVLNYPAGSSVVVEGPGVFYEGTLQAGSDSFSTTTPGEYIVRVSAWPAVDAVHIVRFT